MKGKDTCWAKEMSLAGLIAAVSLQIEILHSARVALFQGKDRKLNVKQRKHDQIPGDLCACQTNSDWRFCLGLKA